MAALRARTSLPRLKCQYSWEPWRYEPAGQSEILRAMSQENVENLRAFWKKWNRGERDLSILDPEVVYEDSNLPDHAGEAYRGHEGVVRATGRWLEPFENLTAELQRVVGEGDRLVSIHHFKATARHTGIEFEGPLAYLYTFRDGKVVHFRSFVDPEEALEAAGLSE